MSGSGTRGTSPAGPESAVSASSALSRAGGSSSGISWFDGAGELDLREPLTTCLDAPSWVEAVVRGRPYGSADALLGRAADLASRIGWDEVAGALARHPRIGERRSAAAQGTREARWSAGEQAAAGGSDAGASDAAGGATEEALRAGNSAYEQRFGYIFLICATGLGRPEILEALRARMTHDDAAEKRVVTDELAKIAVLRLAKLLDEHGGSARQ